MVDLQRVADDTSLDDYPRRCAVVQLARVQEQAEEQRRARDERRMETEWRRSLQRGRRWNLTVSLADLLKWMARAGHETEPLRELILPQDAWIACDMCGQWRRLRGHGHRKLPSAWTCEQSGDAAFADCSVAQELSDDEIDRQLGLVASNGQEPMSFDMVTIMLRGVALPPEPSPSCWAQCDRCGKWRRLVCNSRFASRLSAETWAMGSTESSLSQGNCNGLRW